MGRLVYRSAGDIGVTVALESLGKETVDEGDEGRCNSHSRRYSIDLSECFLYRLHLIRNVRVSTWESCYRYLLALC